ncbi:S41 family peptidase [Flavihumibacter solisilvae]|uniref:Carboxyl-terminal protease n=1 Tax=Flavihumibacter solisilvae TaxID=1349421 RepID=A0A0C1L3G1_9BACT|nr:S41 family peptidase [Flavihumibacter solisilvae]KIC94141.1 carboxyl-terminal protease [Flavihumibacter solisilvae]
MNEKKRLQVWLPLLFAVVMIIGMVLGYKLRDNTQTARGIFQFSTKRAPVQEVLDLIMMKYVDKVNTDTLGNDAIQEMLVRLDPHSSFIPAVHLSEVNEDLQGNFQGIGIEFHIFKDTVNVVSVLSGGPSEKAGLAVGDKFIKVADSSVTGTVTSESIKKLLRGPGGSTVSVTMLRSGKLMKFDIQRGIIPLPSLEAAYMANPGTGYIRISKFSETTYEEFMSALEELKNEGLQSLVLDLRGNGGGILGEAIEIADEFLDGDKLIVYTEGNSVPRQEYRARRRGLFEKGKLALLMDEQSASASEVLAGALQDWDRAVVIGRRSFGKGLVQEQYNLSDGSALRLTVARYYTPSGRSIQKPYDKGIDAYDNDILERYQHGDMVNADSNKIAHGKAYKTSGGKVVYGGGGIMPDHFVAADTAILSKALGELYRNNTINNFTYLYYINNSNQIRTYKNAQAFAGNFKWSGRDWSNFVDFSAKDSVSLHSLPERDKVFLQERMKGLLARYRWRNEGYYLVVNEKDAAVKKAIEILK